MRRIRIIAPAAVFAFVVVGVIAAATAMASEFRAEEYSATLGKELSAEELPKTSSAVLVTDGGTTSCKAVNYVGTLSESATSASVEPRYSGCKLFGLFKATVDANSCKYVFHSTNEEAPLVGSLDVSCNNGDAIEFTTTVTSCVVSIPAQSGLNGVKYENTGSNRAREVRILPNVEGLKYTESASCSSPGTRSTGVFKGPGSLIGSAGGHAVGVYLANEQIEDPALFNTETAPAAISSAQVKSHQFTFDGQSFICGSVAASGEMASMSSASLALAPTYSGCKLFGLYTVAVTMNGCSYQLDVLHNNPIEAAMDILCPAGKVIEMTTSYWGCKITLPEQSGLGTVGMSNTGSGTSRAVTVNDGIGGIVYTESASCAYPGTHSDGAYVGTGTITSSGQGIWVE